MIPGACSMKAALQALAPLDEQPQKYQPDGLPEL